MTSRPRFAPLLTRRFDLYTLDLMCRRYPGAGTPSQAIGAHDTLVRRGYSPAAVRRACFTFDVAMAQFGDAVDRRREETVLKPAPPRKKNEPPKVPVPKYPNVNALLNLEPVEAPNTPAASVRSATQSAALTAWNDDPEAFLNSLIGEPGIVG